MTCEIQAGFSDWNEVTFPWGISRLRRLKYNHYSGTFYALHYDQGLAASYDGRAWTRMRTDGLPVDARYQDLEIIPAHGPSFPAYIFLATDKGLYRAYLAPHILQFHCVLARGTDCIAWNRRFADAGKLLCGTQPPNIQPFSPLQRSDDFGTSWIGLTYEMCGYPNNDGPEEIITDGFLLHSHRAYTGSVYYCEDVNFSWWKGISIPRSSEIYHVGTSGAYAFLSRPNQGLWKLHITDHWLSEIDDRVKVTSLSRGAAVLLVGTLTKGLLRLSNWNPPLFWDSSLNESLPKESASSYAPVTMVATDRDHTKIIVEIYGGGYYNSKKHKFLYCNRA